MCSIFGNNDFVEAFPLNEFKFPAEGIRLAKCLSGLCPPQLLDLLKEKLNINPINRITAEQALRHEVFE
jgi:serine/threonine protein kinase